MEALFSRLLSKNVKIITENFFALCVCVCARACFIYAFILFYRVSFCISECIAPKSGIAAEYRIDNRVERFGRGLF